MAYFVTGATGFIGRHLVECLLEREGDLYLLVRESSREKLDALIERWGQTERIHPVVGDLDIARLGVSKELIKELRGQIDHFFHLAAIYDMTASDEANERLNVDGTRHAVELANSLKVGCLHHVSSVAAAGSFKGTFSEDSFDEGQKLPTPYHRTKFESERIAREDSKVPWRVYRPAVVVGHSKTGEMDKIDGPYYFFRTISRLRRWLPEQLPLVGPQFGWTNIVPVDYVAAAMDHIAHEDGLDGRAFHLAHPRGQRSADVLDTFMRAAHAPHLALRIDARPIEPLSMAALSLLSHVPAAKLVRRQVLSSFGIPDEIVGHVGFTCRFDTREAERALTGSGIFVPELDTYADVLWGYWERKLDRGEGSGRELHAALNGRTVLITGGSSGIGRATALAVAQAGGIPLLVARGSEKLEEAKAEVESVGGTAYTYTADLSDMDSIEQMVAQVLAEHPAVDVLVNNAGRSIRRGVTLSYDRFHDYERTMQLNYFGAIKLIIMLLPHMTARGSGHIVNVSSIGVQTSPPRFSAYVASKAALDAFTRVVSSEVLGDGISFTTIHMPLVRTPMIKPTKMYDAFPAISPEEAAEMICTAIRSKPKHIGTRLGTFGEVLYALTPKTVDRILHLAYRVFPDSAAAKGIQDPDEHASADQIALANLMRGVHW